MDTDLVVVANEVARNLWSTRIEIPQKRVAHARRLLATGRFLGLVGTREFGGLIEEAFLVERQGRGFTVSFALGELDPRRPGGRTRAWILDPDRPVPGDWCRHQVNPVHTGVAYPDAEVLFQSPGGELRSVRVER